ncbi:MAG: hypothetical protein JWR38_4208 [Mucilaginibacter sp.]|nr:hypothetical protein [Mucilaginibacter sp.]
MKKIDYLLFVIASVLLTVAILLATGCKKDEKRIDRSGTFYGSVVQLGQGTVRSFITLNTSGNPETIGMKFSASSLIALPTDTTKEWEYMLELPEQAVATGFNHLAVDWNPVGHDPKPIYGSPHFDFHFYRITKEEQAEVIPGPDTVSVLADYIPQDYISGVIAVPGMDDHWVDSKAPEFNGQKFTNTFIYGFYRGQLTFMEPMASLAWLRTKPDVRINIKQPNYFQKEGYYPTVSHIWYDASTKEYIMALEGLQWEDAYEGDNND